MSFCLFNFDNTFEIPQVSTHLSVPSWQTSIAVIPLEANRLLLDVHEDDEPIVFSPSCQGLERKK
jgi:hypothetical protein